jgi:uncharacterized protein
VGDITTQLERIVERIVFAIGPEAIVLFGSHAKGRARATSDIDLMVVWDTILRPAERLPLVAPLTADFARRVDVVVCTPRELVDMVARPHSFLGSALASGRVLYRRPRYELPSPRKIGGGLVDGSSILSVENCDLRCFIWYAIVWKTVYRFVEIASVLSGKVGPHFGGSGLHLVFRAGA